MGLFASLTAKQKKEQEHVTGNVGGSFFSRSMETLGEGTGKANQAAFDLIAKPAARTAASSLLSAGALQSDVPGSKELRPGEYTGHDAGSIASRILLGDQPINGVNSEATKTAEAFGAKGDTAKNIGKVTGVPLAVLGLYFNPTNLVKTGAVNALTKVKTAEEAAKILSKSGVGDDVIKNIAPQIAKSSDPAEIKNILTAASNSNRPAHQAALEAAHNAGDTKQVQEILDAIPAGDPYKKSMESLFRSEAKVKEATQAVADRTANPNTLDLRGVISESATKPPVKTGVEGAQEILNNPIPKGVGQDIAPIERGGANIENRLQDARDRLLSGLPESPDKIRERLINPENIIKEKNKPTYLMNLRPSADVASDFLGSTGANIVYKLAEGADKERQVIDNVLEHTDKIKELVYGTKGVKKVLPGAEKGVATTKSGQVEMSRKIVSALNDRANADHILGAEGPARKLYDEVVQVFDKIKDERVKRGLPVLDDYSPRALIKDTESKQSSLLEQLTSAFNPDVQSSFSKARKIEENTHINPNIFEVLPNYVASQAKELGYADAAEYIKGNISKVDPSYLTNASNYHTGLRYMQSLVQDLVSPEKTSKFESFANKIVGLKYKSDLRFALKSSLQNTTQRLFANSYVSKAAKKLTKSLSKEDAALIDSHIIGRDLGISDELGKAKKSSFSDKVDKIDPFVRSEKSNVSYATRLGAMEEVLRSPIYQEALKAGKSKTEAITAALSDEATLAKATRRGNVVSNATQFNGNKALKPQAFRDGGNVFGIPTSFLKQYRTFQTGMINNLYQGLIATGKTRELNIIKTGDPREVGLVNYARATRSVDNYLADLEQAASKGEVPDLSAKEVKLYRGELKKHLDTLNKQVAEASGISRKKTAANLAKAWGAAFAIQTLFDGSLYDSVNYVTGGGTPDSQEAGGKAVAKNARYSSPVNVPTKSQDVTSLTPAISKEKPGNLIPIVGPAIKRAKEVNKLVKSVTGKPLVETGK